MPEQRVHRVAPVTGDAPRPFWSVMIPTHEPSVAQLEEAIRSVLAAPVDDAQIELVDDGSTHFDPESFVANVGDDRVRASRHENRGIGASWNRCIERARGAWVHLLHQDDVVRPAFYAELRAAIERHPGARAAVGQAEFLDSKGRPRSRSFPPGVSPGILDDWIEHVFVDLKIQCASIVVRRDVYEELGGFDESLRYVLDWDLWKRIASRHALVYAPRAVAGYRVHAASATSRLAATGRDMAEILASIERDAHLLPPDLAGGVRRRARENYARFAIDNAGKILRRSGDVAAVLRQLRGAREFTSWGSVMRYAGARLIGRGRRR